MFFWFDRKPRRGISVVHLMYDFVPVTDADQPLVGIKHGRLVGSAECLIDIP